MNPLGFLGPWTLMMAAMMLPAAAPMILLHGRKTPQRQGGVPEELHRILFAATYVLVWAAVGVPVWLASVAAMAWIPNGARPPAVAAVLAVAGAYQLTPLKAACLRQCRTPIDFLITHWRPGLGGELRLGVEHGLYCLGCCWALMAVLVAAGAMGMAWAVAIAAVVFVEKILPGGAGFGRLAGLALIGLAAIVLLRPETASQMAGGM